MAGDSITEVAANALGLALDAIEARLDALAPSAGADVVALALADPVRAFDAAAAAALREA